MAIYKNHTDMEGKKSIQLQCSTNMELLEGFLLLQVLTNIAPENANSKSYTNMDGIVFLILSF